jgi:penicillin-binding protein 1A
MHRDFRPREEAVIQWIWRLFFGFICALILWFIYLSFQDLPSFDDLENPSNKQASQVFDGNGADIGRYYIENRVPVRYEELSPNLVNALIATEDIRFKRHSGIDFIALGRVAVKTVFMGDTGSGGGSTITQQLAKLLYSDRDFSGMGKLRKAFSLVSIKMKEWITAVKLERAYTKEEIISMYLNHFNFINGAYGIKAASEIYFGVGQDSLAVEEAATLVGMLQNPSLYNPLRRPELTMSRRNVVLAQMRKNGHIDKATFEVLKDKPIDISRFSRASHDEGLAPYFRMELRKEILTLLDRPECRKPNGEKYDIYRDGLRIYTTIDTSVQKELEAAVALHMPVLQKKFWRTWKNRDPWTHMADNNTEAEIELRQQKLQEQVRAMERYMIIRSRSFEPFVEQQEIKIGRIMLRDLDVDRMLRELAKPGYLKELQDLKIISPSMVKDYKAILNGDVWAELKKKWDTYQKELEEMLSTPVKMVVFDYESPGFQKDTLMSPLDSLKYHRMILQTGVVAIDPSTGYVRGWVGGVNYRHFQYDHVKSDRQVGSTFKPFVYATAVALQSISPCMRLYDNPQTIIPGEGNFNLDKEWTPRNFDEYSGESYTLFEGLRKSKNTFSVYLMKQLGDTEPVRGLINIMGIDSSARTANGSYRVPRQPSIALGSADLSVLEMTGAYSTFANDGVFNKPVMVTRIEDAYGRVIFQEAPLERRALSPESNFVMVEMLRFAARGAAGFSGVKSDFGGKTGTTNFYADGWYIGITPSLVIGVWVGGEDRWIRFTNPADGQGSVLARPIFSEALRGLENNPFAPYDATRRFKSPGNIGIELNCGQYQKPSGEEVPGDDQEFFEDIFNESF